MKEQLELFEEEEEPLPTWEEILKDPETWPILGAIILCLALNFLW
tara:strand:- start:310 stop:444 length:135 start_codon:yes stop_codon:yes gene_type:complete